MPVLLGAATLLYSFFMAGYFGLCSLALSDSIGWSLTTAIPAMAAMLMVSQMLGALGLLLHRNWGRVLIQGTSLGVIVLVGAWFGEFVAFRRVHPGMVIFAAMTLVWPVTVNFLLNSRAMKEAVGLDPAGQLPALLAAEHPRKER